MAARKSQVLLTFRGSSQYSFSQHRLLQIHMGPSLSYSCLDSRVVSFQPHPSISLEDISARHNRDVPFFQGVTGKRRLAPHLQLQSCERDPKKLEPKWQAQ